MDWIAIGTLIASLIAAIGAAWSVVISREQLTLAAKSAETPSPVVEATISEVGGQPGWSRVDLELRNVAPISLELLAIAVDRPRNVVLLTSDQAHGRPPNDWNDRPLLDPLPADAAALKASVTAQMGRAGYSSHHSPGELALRTAYAHCSLRRFLEEAEPRLILEMRWRDQTTKTFAMAVNIIKPNTA